jgi:CHASE2 domain-containing sensor protein
MRCSARAASENVVVVAIDDNALSHGRLGEWSRSLHAQTINELTAAGPHHLL